MPIPQVMRDCGIACGHAQQGKSLASMWRLVENSWQYVATALEATHMPPTYGFDSKPRLKPPETLYKFLIPGLVTNVLEYGTAKFTQMANTNDIFEVRKTFERFAGPRFDEFFKKIRADNSTKAKIDAKFDEKLTERLGTRPSRHMRRAAKKGVGKKLIYKTVRDEFEKGADLFSQHINSDDASEMFLDMYGKDMMCFSLTESYDNQLMWAHYAENNKGFVVGFKADHPWFNNKDDQTKTRLHKVTYFDGILDELLEDPEVAFGSKTTAWSYEREWRMYCGMKEIEKTIASSTDPIHLINFPPGLVQSIIIGAKASEETTIAIKTIAAARYPHAQLFFAKPNSRTASFELEPI